MRGKITRRTISRSRQTLAVWAMLPLVVLSDRAVYGCVAADGKISTTCRCCAAKAATKCNCCNAQMHSSSTERSAAGPTGGERMSAGHCRAITVYSVAQAIGAPERADFDCANHAALPTILPPAPIGRFVALELNTGQEEPLQLLTQLHRWII